MADLTELQSSQTVKVAGANASGAETNFMDVDSSGNAKTVVNNGAGSSSVNIQDGGNSITVDATSLPLPTGASTAANQTTGNAYLANIDGGLPDTLGQKTMAGSTSVVVSSDQSTIPVSIQSSVEIEIKNDTGNPVPVSASTLPLPAGAATSANQTTANTYLANIDAGLPDTLGQKVMTGSTSVAIASDQSTIPVSIQSSVEVEIKNDTGNPVPVSVASLPLPVGGATSANQTSELTKLDTLHTDLTTLDTDLKASQPRKLQDGSGNNVTSQVNGTQRALDIGVNVGGVQVDPRQVRVLTSSDVVTSNIKDSSGNSLTSVANELNIRDAIQVGGVFGAQSVTTTAAEAKVGASRLTNRKALIITPTNGTVYWGLTSSVTTTTGTPIFKNQTTELAFSIAVYLIAGTTTDCRIVEAN